MGRKKIPTSQGERTSSSADDDAVAHASLLKKKAWMAFSKRTADHLADQIRKGETVSGVETRLSWVVVHSWYEQLPPLLKSRVDGMGFKDFFSIEPFRVDRALIASLSERWRDETHSFHFPPGELTISLEDIVQCWGLRVVGTPVFSEGDYSEPDANRDLFRNFFGFLPTTKGAQIPLTWLYTTYCPAKAQESAHRRLAAQGVTPDVEVGDVEAPNGGGSSASSGGGGEDGASGAIPPVDVVKEQHRSGTNAGSSSGVSRKGIPTASHKRRRAAGIPDLEFEVYLRKKVVVNPRESFQPPGESANMNPDAHLRAFLLYFLGSTFFCGSSGNFAIGALLHYLEDLGKFKDYAWGAAALAHLFWSLDNRVRSGRGRNNLGGFVAIMQVWAWEHLSTCRPTQLLDRWDLFPRAARWYPSANMRSFERTLPAEVAARLRHAGLRHGENEYRYVYNELDDNEILWRPYDQITEASPAIVREAIHLFNKDIWLHAPRIAARLVMSRATRQFQDHAVVPPPSDDPLTYMYKGWSQRTFKSSHPCAEEIEDWNEGGQLAGRHVSALPYDTWWLTTPHRQFLPREYRGGSYFTIKNRFEELEQLRGEKAALEREVGELRVHPSAGVSPQVPQSEILMKEKEDLQRRMREMERKWREEKEEMERKLKEKEESEQRLQDRLADMEQTIEGLTNQDQLSEVQKEVASLRTELANLKSLEAVALEDGALCKKKVNGLENALSVKEAAWKQKEEALVTSPLSLRRSKRNHRVT
eukprot:TRINITY_DN1906_c0_g1_i1.p1 TRINITY_DN1906_c0_g1~~TRINITY_DN1906_c0_g1_i1.p1  ORF type:complete len:759 (+),score=112.96 TRINITY_DN1906_c0_g1_i1:187-2463(+)